jgi:hypothetical protein
LIAFNLNAVGNRRFFPLAATGHPRNEPVTEITCVSLMGCSPAALLMCQSPLQISRDPISRSARGNRLTNGFPAIDSYRLNRSQKWKRGPKVWSSDTLKWAARA